MYKRKILILSFLALMVFVPFLDGCTNKLPDRNAKAVTGTLDLSEWRIEQEVIKLDGQWEFYRDQLLEPSELKDIGTSSKVYIDLPGSWNRYLMDDKGLPGDGYATYRLLFKAEESSRLGLKIPRIFTSYKLSAFLERPFNRPLEQTTP